MHRCLLQSHGFWRKFSPYYKETHHKFRAAVRDFVDRELRPDAAKVCTCACMFVYVHMSALASCLKH